MYLCDAINQSDRIRGAHDLNNRGGKQPINNCGAIEAKHKHKIQIQIQTQTQNINTNTNTNTKYKYKHKYQSGEIRGAHDLNTKGVNNPITMADFRLSSEALEINTNTKC